MQFQDLDLNSSNFKFSITKIPSRTARDFTLKLKANATVFTESDQAFIRAIKSN